MSDNEGSTVRSVSPPNEDSQHDLRSLLIDFHADSKKQFEESQKQWQTSFLDLKNDMTQINSHLLSIVESANSECRAYTEKQVSDVRSELKSDFASLSDRMSLLEGQSARLAALETSVQKLQITHSKSSSIPPVVTQSLLEINSPKKAKFSFGPQLSSSTFTTQTNPVSTNFHPSVSDNHIPSSSNPTNTSFKLPPLLNQFSSFNNSSILSQEKYSECIPEFNGYLTPIHPEAFLVEINDYFQFQDIPDFLKINMIRRRMIGDAKQWFNALTPPPNTFHEFVELFRQHFWSYSKQIMTRNDLSRPYSHRDTSTLQKHAIEWINKAKYLNPPIENETLIFQILSHFPETVASPLRILRIKTLNELIDHLSYAEHSSRPLNNNNNFSNNSPNSHDISQNHRSNNNMPPNRNNYQDRFQGRASYNNNDRSQHHTNNPTPNPPNVPHTSPSPSTGNDQ